MGGKRKVMFTGDIAHAIGIPDYTSKNLEDLTDNEIHRLAAALKV